MGVLVRYAFCLAFALGITLATQSAALADRRIALVIGNGKYENAGVLANPINDADAIADLLTKAGFDFVDRRSIWASSSSSGRFGNLSIGPPTPTSRSSTIPDMGWKSGA